MRPFAFCSKISEIQFIRNDHGVHPVVDKVTQRIIQRSRPSRQAYLAHLDAARVKGVQRGTLACTNLAHGFAAFPANDKLKLREQKQPSVAIVSSYNDMLSAHQPFEYFPKVIKDAVREVGAVAQFAGGVPAMCDGVTQGQPGMELSLFSRDTIAMSTAIALSHNMFDSAAVPGHLRQDRAGPADRRAALRPYPGHLRAGRPDDHRYLEQGKGRGAPALRERARPRAKNCSKARPRPTTAPAPAPSTAPPTATRC
jgi:hypothetical protein